MRAYFKDKQEFVALALSLFKTGKISKYTVAC